MFASALARRETALIKKALIKDTWARYGFYEDDGSEAFNLEVEEPTTGQFED